MGGVYDDLFPILDEEQRDATNSKKHIDSIWQQLDHMGNAGFDPAIFRIDVYGNVLHWDADPGSPLAWDVDHWFPHARGGETVLSNLGVLLHTMLCGYVPFDGETTPDIFQAIKRGRLDLKKDLWPSIFAESKDLLKGAECSW